MSTADNSDLLQEPLTLPCGAVLPNRICKAAMTEGLATPEGLPSAELNRLYELWSDGGAGVLLSGNIQVDADHLERPGNVIVDRLPNNEMQSALASWAKAGTRNGNHFWAQISHAGRQTQINVNKQPKAPSAVAVGLPGGQFGQPVPMSEAEITDITGRFGTCAKACQEAGFTGVQVHAAHGYLISQFLSPRTNLRKDDYGGTLENRARILLEIVSSIRQAVGSSFPIAVKLNSADFQKGGFEFTDSMQVAKWLEAASVDVIEISGGTYEQPRLLGVEGIEEVAEQDVKASTIAREAYFLEFAIALRQEISIPLMVTGGFRQKQSMEAALENGADIIGLGRPMCVMTDAPSRLFSGLAELPRYESELTFFPTWLNFLNRFKSLRTLSTFGVQYWYYAQLELLGQSGRPQPEISTVTASKRVMDQQKNWLAQRPPR